jgi:phosphonate utilization associated putative membrane protein
MIATSVGATIGASVLMHVAWNLMARHQPREAEPLWWVLLAHTVMLAPWGLYCLLTEARWGTQLVCLLLISACANVVYFFALARAYRHAPVALVYPLVRSSPLFIAVWSWLLFSEQLAALAWVGIALNVLGLLVLAASSKGGQEGRALPWALLAMLATSVYSLSDKAATGYVPSFGAVVGYISVGYIAAWVLMTLRIKRVSGNWMPQKRIGTSAMILGGLCIGTAYALVIHAMRALPAAEVVSYTNAGIVIATLASILVFRERAHWRARTAGAAVICVGLAMLAFGRSLG